MQGTLVVPGRRLQGRLAMGQLFHQYQIPKATPIKDVERAYSAEELMKALSELKTAEEALNLYKANLLNYSIMTKAAFLTDLWKKIKVSPEMMKALEATEDGRAWIDIFQRSEAAFLSYTQPNLFTSAGRVKTALETVLLRRFGIAPKGRVPIYRPGAAELDYADTIVPSVGVKQVYDFGDLSKTTLREDVKSLEEVMRVINPNFRMRGVIIVTLIITAGATIVGLYYSYRATEPKPPQPPPSIPPEILEIYKKLPPKEAAEAVKHHYNSTQVIGGSAGSLDKFVEIMQWLAVAAGVMIVGAIAINYFVSK